MMGQILFYLLWPLIWFYAPLQIRSRVVLKADGNVLGVKNWFGPNVWMLPGGGVKWGESLAAAACREIQEELGLILDESKLAALTKEPISHMQRGLLFREVFYVYELPKKPKLSLDRELRAAEWIQAEDCMMPATVLAHLMRR